LQSFRNLLEIKVCAGETPKTSIVVTVFNQAEIIEKVLNLICANTGEKFELIVIDDSSSDGTTEVLYEFLRRVINPNDCNFCSRLTRVVLAKSRISVFETKCDQYGINLSTAETVMLIQSDMFITENNFDVKMGIALYSSPNIFLLSARGVAPIGKTTITLLPTPFNVLKKFARLLISLLSQKNQKIEGFQKSKKPESFQQNDIVEMKKTIFPNSIEFKNLGSAGWRGSLLENWNSTRNATQISLPDSKIWLSDFPMRGPCIFKLDIFKKIGGLNTRAFFLGGDIGDICSRAQVELELRSGFYPISFLSPPELGSTRKKRSVYQKFLFIYNLVKCSLFVKQTDLYRYVLNFDKNGTKNQSYKILSLDYPSEY
jgi:glycosyltransferase involved in cell wall biosynthesis